MELLIKELVGNLPTVVIIIIAVIVQHLNLVSLKGALDRLRLDLKERCDAIEAGEKFCITERRTTESEFRNRIVEHNGRLVRCETLIEEKL